VLRALQEQKIERVGGEKTIDVDVRIIAATNKNLEEECEAGRFRRDLFFRLNVIPLYIPPLRDRTEDIPILLYHFLNGFGWKNFDFDAESLDFLSSYEWPGNVRELKNLAERITVMYDEGRIDAESLRGLLQKTAGVQKQSAKKDKPQSSDSQHQFFEQKYNEAKEFFEKSYLEYHFSKNGCIISKTAENIGMYPSNLHAKLKKYGLRTEQ
jgi:two-component system nitrogen regulation response regulator NtrX